MDNASNNDTAIRSFAENVPEAGIESYQERRIRCMEHALHLAAGHFVDDISPTSSSELTKKLWARELDSDSADEDEEFDVADALGKALALVTQV